RVADFESESPLGPAVFFDQVEDAVPLDAFLRRHPDLDFGDRIALLEQVGRALAHCHRKEVVHGAVSPDAVLVRRDPTTQSIDARLFNFQLGGSQRVEATTHWSALAQEPWAVYRAPELRQDPTQLTPLADMFSLGALAYFVLTGRPPGETPEDVDRTLADRRALDPRATGASLQDAVAEIVEAATKVAPVERYDDVGEWVELLLDEATTPEAEERPPEADPLTARRGELLGEDLVVEGVLGQGATSRVLEVRRGSDDRRYALKVSLGPDHDDRLAREAHDLRKFRHERIVELVDEVRVGGRPCLLLTLAGTRTLHKHLQTEGPVALDLAHRYGEDLLWALQTLEEKDVFHRDIKPANLGVGSATKGAHHLTLFDFSLADADPTDLHVGTSAYRDPFLAHRGRWDFHAERWSAAVTLHEMLTGVRPRFEGAAIDPEARLHIAAERFDPAVRGTLTAFFERAFARDVKDRFASAAEMRRAFSAALEAVPRDLAPAAAAEGAPEAAPDATDERFFASLDPATPIDALPLSPRARNALDRAGITRAEQLLALPNNRLSAIRGIGTRVAQDILAFRDRWRAARDGAPEAEPPFFAGYRGEDILVETSALPAALASALRDAGLASLAAVASAPTSQVQGLAQRLGLSADAVRSVLAAEHERAGERARPTTLEGWVDALLPPKRKSMKHPRGLFGLDGPLEGRPDASVREYADAAGVTPARVYQALGKARDTWAKHGAFAELRDACAAVVEAAGGALPLSRAAERLRASLAHDRAAPDPTLRVCAAALLRIAAEVDRDDDTALRYVRLHDRVPWLCESDAHLHAVRALGEAADRLAQSPVPASAGKLRRTLRDTVADTPLATLPDERLIELAVDASRHAARSSRLEIYPRGMQAARALALSATVLHGGLDSAQVRERVHLRYPEAEPLPDRPALDELMAAQGYTFGDDGRYHRPGDPESTSLGTRASPLHRHRTALPTQPRAARPASLAAREWDERLRDAVERRAFRVLGVVKDRAVEAAQLIGRRIGVEPVPFDVRFVQAMREEMRAAGMEDDAVVHDTDRAGPADPDWPLLRELAARAAARVADRLLPPRAPLLLVQPGPIARYALTAFLERLRKASEDPAAAAILLLVPSPDTGGIPAINGTLPIPGVLPSQVLWVSREWLQNQHNAAA
ncbi:MAG: protein kinase domain-containing protein, partial [Myxococcota bacterium]